MIPSHLVLTSKHIIKLREQLGEPAYAAVMWRRPFSALMMITCKKKHPDVLSMKYECAEGEPPTPKAAPKPGEPAEDEEPSVVERYQVPQYVDAKAALQLLVGENRSEP